VPIVPAVANDWRDAQRPKSYAAAVGALTIVLALALNAGTNYVVDRTKLAAARAGLLQIKDGLHRYYLDNGYYPSTDQGLDALLPPDSIDPGIFYPAAPHTRRLLDPWGHLFEYESDGRTYAVKCLGPDTTESETRRNLTVTGGP
jgi:general secretion pathway protein G